MADRLLMVTWDEPVRGAEARAVEVFNDALGILGRMQQEGRIEKFDVALLEPNGGLGGFITVLGSQDQITAMRADEQWHRNTVEATLCVDGMKHVEGVCNDGVATEMALYVELAGAVPQRA
ncbi:MAG: hypothetical protein QOF76_4857 [Solirubrobacteraceae bacterium]|jgi:hypothetical protein|nr:hypothetical protein [Solirubrobacteraceae bacterium]